MASAFLFFAFGEMVTEAHMEQIDPLCELMGPAKAVNHRLAFTGEGHANLLPDAGAGAGGTLWLVPATAMEAMGATAAAKGFQRGVIFVVSPAGPKVPATVYHDPAAPEYPPPADILAAVVASAKSMKLDRRFLRELKNLAN